jgi:predicted amidophosphoribosyltransferase
MNTNLSIPPPAFCSSCKNTFFAAMQSEKKGTITEYFLECPHCQKKYHSYRMNRSLSRLQQRFKSAKSKWITSKNPRAHRAMKKLKKRYEKEFREFNSELFGETLGNVESQS